MKHIFFNVEEEELKGIIKQQKINLKDIVLIEVSPPNNVSELNITRERIVPNIRENRQEQIHWLNDWMRRKIKGKSIREHFVYENQTLIYLLEYFIYYTGFIMRKSNGLDYLMGMVDTLRKYSNEAATIYSYDPYRNVFVRLAKDIWKKKLDIKFNKPLIVPRFLKLESKVILRWYLKFRLVARYIIGKIRKNILGKKQENKELIISSSIRFYSKKPERNSYFGNIMSLLPEKYDLIYYDRPDRWDDLKRVLKNRLIKENSYIGDYYSLKVFKEIRDIVRILKKQYKQIKDDKEFKESFNYKGINLYPYIKKRLDYTFLTFNYFNADTIAITKEILKKTNPKAVLVDQEYNRYALGYILNSKNNDVATIATQYELIFPRCIHLHKKEKKILNKKNISWRPLPDKKLVWSEYSKDTLINYCNYPKNIIEVTGNHIFDKLVKSKRKFHAQPKIKALIAIETNYPAYNIILEAAKKTPEAEFIIKPHPHSIDKDFSEFFRNKPENIILRSKFENIYDLMDKTDIVITKHSTAGIEAMIKGKYVIILDIDAIETIPYKKSKACIIARNPGEIKKAINNITKNREIREKLEENMKKFLLRFSYTPDGKASVRVAEEIKNVLKSKS